MGSSLLKQVYKAAKGMFVRNGNIFRDEITSDWWKYFGVTLGTGDKVELGGDAAGSRYLDIIKSPLYADTVTNVIPLKDFRFPARVGVGLSKSQNITGQLAGFETAGVDNDGNVVDCSDCIAPAIAISGSISVTTNVATINFATSHGFHSGARVEIYGCADSRMNVGRVMVTVVSATQITVPLTIANGTYTATGGYVAETFLVQSASDSVGLWWEASANAALFSVRGKGATEYHQNSTVTTASISGTAPSGFPTSWLDAVIPTAWFEIKLDEDGARLNWQSVDTATSAPSGIKRSVMNIDMFTKARARFSVRNQKNFSNVIAKVISASKAGSTTATVTTDVDHGLVAGQSYVKIYGNRDTTNFANLTTDTVVASTPTSNTFTIVWGASVTATGYGGAVLLSQGSPASTGMTAQNIKSIASTVSGQLAITLAATATSAVPERILIHGVYDTSGNPLAYPVEGIFRVRYASGTSVIVDGYTGEAFTSTNCGGAIVKCTEFRIHFYRISAWDPISAKIVDADNSNDAAKAMPCAVMTMPTVTIAGGAAHDAAVSGNPTRVAGKALTANAAVSATGDTVDLIGDTNGRQIVRPYSIPEVDFDICDSITNSTTAVQIKAALASNKCYVTGLSISNAVALAAATTIQLRSTAAASPSATISANTLVMAATYNWRPGDLIYVISSTVTGLTASSYFYLLTASTTSLTFSATRGGSTLSISGSSVTATIAKVLWRHQLSNAVLPVQNIVFPTPLSGGTGLSIEMCTPSAVAQQIDFCVQGHTAA